MMHLYSALCIVVHPKRFTIMCVGLLELEFLCSVSSLVAVILLHCGASVTKTNSSYE